MTPPRKTMPGGVPIQDPQYTPTPVLVEEIHPQSQGPRSLVTALSTVLGVLVATTVLLGFVGKYFFVDRAEYVEDKSATQKVLLRVEMTMSQQASILDRQEKAFDRMAETVRSLELAGGRRR